MEAFNLTVQDLDGFFDESSRMSDLFVWIESEFAAQGKLVCQFVVNGKKISEKEELDLAPQSIRVAQNVRVLVQSEKELVIDVMESWIQALPELESFIDNHLLKNKDLSSTSFIDELIQLNEQQESFVESLMTLKRPLKRMNVNMINWENSEKALHHYVMQCVKAVETKNFVLLLQAVEYDGCEVFNQWMQQLSQAVVEVRNFKSEPPSAVLDLANLRKVGT
jgi:hypothetical protein